MNKIKKSNNFTVLTLGCSKNVVDSERIIANLKANNFEFTPDLKQADTLIINTCGFIKPAKEESLNVILEACELRRKGKIKKLIVCGCLSQRYENELKEQIKYVDEFYGINPSEKIIKLLTGDYKHNLIGESRILTPKHYAYIKISDGCSHPCTFCAIPLIRGQYWSEPEENILHEVRQLAENGTKEFILIAQDTTYYGKDINGKRTLADLLSKISDIKGVEWLRLMYTYPTQFPLDVLDVIADKPNICKYIDIPLQHISDYVLKSMRRGITSRQIIELLEKIRKTIPNIAIRSTFIVGYPNETEKDFQELLDFIKKTELDRVGVFTYSREEDTSAFDLDDPITEEIKQERMKLIMQAQSEISLKKNREKIGTQIKILIDEKKDGNYIGRTEHDAPDIDNSVIITSDFDLNPGDFVIVEITRAEEYDLYGRAVSVAG